MLCRSFRKIYQTNKYKSAYTKKMNMKKKKKRREKLKNRDINSIHILLFFLFYQINQIEFQHDSGGAVGGAFLC